VKITRTSIRAVTVRFGAITVVALSGAFFAGGCSLISPQAPPPPPPPAIINTGTTQLDELEHEVKEKDARIAALTGQLTASKEEIAELKEQKEVGAPTPAIPDDGNASPANADTGAASSDAASASSADDSSDTGSPESVTVWVNTSSNSYYLPGSKFYGKGSGQYMTEDQATNDGYKRSGHR